MRLVSTEKAPKALGPYSQGYVHGGILYSAGQIAITTNCAVLGVSLNCVTKGYNILEGVVYGFSTAVGFTIAIVIMAGIREKIEYNDISESFQGTPIVLLTAALMSIAFFGFSGII